MPSTSPVSILRPELNSEKWLDGLMADDELQYKSKQMPLPEHYYTFKRSSQTFDNDHERLHPDGIALTL